MIYYICEIKKKKLQISGTLEASDDPSDYIEDSTHWLKFEGVQKLSLHGGGTINGNGNIWWKKSCKRNKTLVIHQKHPFFYYHFHI